MDGGSSPPLTPKLKKLQIMQYVYVLDFHQGGIYIYQTEIMDSDETEKYIRLKGHSLNHIEWMATDSVKLHIE